jgi:hypothetical protein
VSNVCSHRVGIRTHWEHGTSEKRETRKAGEIFISTIMIRVVSAATSNVVLEDDATHSARSCSCCCTCKEYTCRGTGSCS